MDGGEEDTRNDDRTADGVREEKEGVAGEGEGEGGEEEEGGGRTDQEDQRENGQRLPVSSTSVNNVHRNSMGCKTENLIKTSHLFSLHPTVKTFC